MNVQIPPAAVQQGQTDTTLLITEDLHWDIADTCNDPEWCRFAADRPVAEALLKAGGVPIPKTVAVIDTSYSTYPGLPKIGTGAELCDFLTFDLCNGLIGKSANAASGLAPFRIDQADFKHIQCRGQAPMTYATFMGSRVANNAYVLQRTLMNHPDIDRYCNALATVRMMNLMTKHGVYVAMAMIRLPQRDLVANGNRHGGKVLSEIDITTGQITTNGHRVDGAGVTLPHWQNVLDINAKAARVFNKLRYQFTDIAITPTGPVVIDLNDLGGFDMPHYNDGPGHLTPKIRHVLSGLGYHGAGARTKAA